jgi:hypothetical protein
LKNASRSLARDVALVGVFFVGLLAPLCDQLVRAEGARDSRAEFRTPAPLPKVPESLAEIDEFPPQFDAWYLDHFGLREPMLRALNAVKWFGFHTSPTRNLVLGREDNVFNTTAFALEDQRGAMPLLPGHLDAWRRMLERRRDWLAARGIRYVFAISPYKTEVYPDLLPCGYDPVGPKRADQLIEHLARTSDFRILDLRPLVRGERAADTPLDPTYFTLGTHWTDRAAHRGYVELVRHLGTLLPALEPLPDAAFETHATNIGGENWAGRLYLGGLLEQHSVDWELREPRARSSDDPERAGTYVATNTDDTLPRALVCHDSFTLPLRPWLAEHFSRLACVWSTELELEPIESARPDVVIQIFNGFSLMQLEPHLARFEDGGERERRFERCGRVLWRFDPARFPEGLRTDDGSRMHLDGDEIVLERSKGGSVLHLPEIEYPRGEDLLVRIELDYAEPGLAQIQYRTRRWPRLGRLQSVGAERRPGKDALVLEVPEAEFTGRLALWLGARTGTARIQSIEIRSARPEIPAARATDETR